MRCSRHMPRDWGHGDWQCSKLKMERSLSCVRWKEIARIRAEVTNSRYPLMVQRERSFVIICRCSDVVRVCHRWLVRLATKRAPFVNRRHLRGRTGMLMELSSSLHSYDLCISFRYISCYSHPNSSLLVYLGSMEMSCHHAKLECMDLHALAIFGRIMVASCNLSVGIINFSIAS